MRVFTIQSTEIQELDTLPQVMPALGFIWLAMTRQEFQAGQADVQAQLQKLCGTVLVDLHISDLLNPQLPSHYDYTSQYDVLIFRRLTAGSAASEVKQPLTTLGSNVRKGGPPVLKRIDTSPIAFVTFERLLLTVHPADCAVLNAYTARLQIANGTDTRASGARIPHSPADLMLRIVNQIVDSYLDLRRELTHQLDHWQAELLSPRARFTNWQSLLDARLSLHQLDEICEDQRAAVQDWIDALGTWPHPQTPQALRERDLLAVRSRDVLEHIERVVHHVRRLEQSAETAVQMHFSAQSNRTNDIMRTLTSITAIFLPLNLIVGIFGTNFEYLPIIHSQTGFWWMIGSMLTVAIGMGLIFWRKRYLARTRH